MSRTTDKQELLSAITAVQNVAHTALSTLRTGDDPSKCNCLINEIKLFKNTFASNNLLYEDIKNAIVNSHNLIFNESKQEIFLSNLIEWLNSVRQLTKIMYDRQNYLDQLAELLSKISSLQEKEHELMLHKSSVENLLESFDIRMYQILSDI